MRDFSMYLSNELIKTLGEPYQSSIAVVRRFAKGNLRVYVGYERERDEVDIEGSVVTGGVTLPPDDVIAFIEEVSKVTPSATTFRIESIGKGIQVFPIASFSDQLAFYDEKERIPEVLESVTHVFSALEKIEEIMVRYQKKEIGYAEVGRTWHEAIKTTDPNEKGKLLERVFLDLIQLDGSFLICAHNVRTESEEIDIVVQPDTSSLFWSKVLPPIILLECKNWKEKVGTSDVQVFAGKIENRPRLLCRVGFLISVSGFTADAEKELIGYRARDFMLATITRDQIEELIQKKNRISDLLQQRLIDAGFR